MGQSREMQPFRATPIAQRKAEAEGIFQALKVANKIAQEEKRLIAQVESTRPKEPARVLLVSTSTRDNAQHEREPLIWLP